MGLFLDSMLRILYQYKKKEAELSNSSASYLEYYFIKNGLNILFISLFVNAFNRTSRWIVHIFKSSIPFKSYLRATGN